MHEFNVGLPGEIPMKTNLASESLPILPVGVELRPFNKNHKVRVSRRDRNSSDLNLII